MTCFVHLQGIRVTKGLVTYGAFVGCNILVFRSDVILQLLSIGTGPATERTNNISLSHLGQVVGSLTLLVLQARVYTNGLKNLYLEVM